MSRVHVVGSINQDLVAGAERHPRPGETVRGSTFRTHPGGKGANQAIAAARAGASVSLTGCVGADTAGEELLSFLRDAGVDCEGVAITADAPTGTGVITVAAGENTIVIVSGANSLVGRDQVARIAFATGDICVAQLETPTEATAMAFRRARAKSATTLLNAAPSDQAADELVALSDILVVNALEFTAIFGLAVDEYLAATAVPSAVSRRFPGTLVVTLGADGASVREGATHFRIPGHEVVAVDSTGAGDTFVGYFAAGLAGGYPLEQAARRANRASAISVTRHGAASSIPVASEVG